MNGYKISKLESDTINLLRFPMIIGVILVHSKVGEVVINGESVVNQADFPFFYHLYFAISHILVRLVVPLWFFVSGFLFFLKPVTDWNSWVQKIKKRASTLLLPYLVWNAIYLLMYFLGEMCVPQLFSGNNKLISDTPFLELLGYLWSRDGMPIDYPLWFIRDLIVVNLFSYLIMMLIQKGKSFFLLLLGVLWFSQMDGLSANYGLDAFFFFSLGAYFSISQRGFLDVMRPLMPYSVVLYVCMAVCLTVVNWDDCAWAHPMYVFSLLVGMVAILTLVPCWIKKFSLKANEFLTSSAFFIYAFHALPLAFIVKVLCKYLPVNSEISILALFLLSALLVILLGLAAYQLVRKYCKPLVVLLTGGR